MIKMHEEKGFAFTPLDLHLIDGDITYGDTSMSIEYIHQNFPEWKIEATEYNDADPYQIILFLKPV